MGLMIAQLLKKSNEQATKGFEFETVPQIKWKGPENKTKTQSFTALENYITCKNIDFTPLHDQSLSDQKECLQTSLHPAKAVFSIGTTLENKTKSLFSRLYVLGSTTAWQNHT